MDELAEALGIDPLEFRRKNLRDDRLRAVLDAAAETVRLGKGEDGRRATGSALRAGPRRAATSPPAPRSPWIANEGVTRCGSCGSSPRSSAGRSSIRTISKNQVEGAVVMGLGGALFEAIRFENGTIRNPRFARYRVPRFTDLPEIEVVLLDRPDLPSAGAGESPIVAIAPAVGNAIFGATGIRLRSLPMVPDGLKA